MATETKKESRNTIEYKESKQPGKGGTLDGDSSEQAVADDTLNGSDESLGPTPKLGRKKTTESGKGSGNR